MHVSRKLLAFFLALFLASTSLLRAQQNTPVPSQIASATTVFVSNAGGSDDPDRAYSQMYSDLQKWGRYQLVDSPQQADLIFEIRSISPLVASNPDVYNPQLVLRVLDPKTSAVLWTISAPISAAVRQKTYDKNLDTAVTLLLYQTRRLVGEQLTPAQQKALVSSNHMATSTKVLIVVGIAAFAAITAIGIHAATSHRTPQLPSLPSCIPPLPCPAI